MSNRPIGVSLLLALAALAGQSRPLAGQAMQAARLPLQADPLVDLRGFRTPPPSWRIVGEAAADRNQKDVMTTAPGTGVLANLPAEAKGGDLYSAWEHGDLELDLDFMMPKGSNSGIYLQGRYEVQLFDSWGVRRPAVHDLGALYERWDESRPDGQKGYEGKAPLFNAARAPGLWQHMTIVFRAPRFDARGRKVQNARFERVVLNGVTIHENVEVTGPTRGSAYPNEGPAGPLRIQGDHGPVAFRNLRFQRYGLAGVKVADLRSSVYEGEFASLAALGTATPARRAAVPEISTAEMPEKSVVVYDGVLEVPAAGRYLFDLGVFWMEGGAAPGSPATGAGRLTIDGREVLANAGPRPGASAEVELTAGRHPFQLALLRNSRRPARLGFYVEGPGVARQPLFDTDAFPPPAPAAPITVEPGAEPVVLRSFMRYGNGKRTQVVSVGDPGGVHYSVDLGRGALLHAWRGPFLETTPMWNSRGEDQIATPLGSTLLLSGAPSVAALPDAQAAWPDSLDESAYRLEGYTVDAAGRPTFLYRVGGVQVEDRIAPAADGVTLRRELKLRAARPVDGLYVRIAEGASVRRLADGSYAVDDLRYYVAPEGGVQPVVRSRAGRQEILVPVRPQGDAATVAYGILW